MTDMPQVTVRFADETRLWPAHLEPRTLRDGLMVYRLVPDDDFKYDFLECLDGVWVALERMRD